MTGSGMSTAEQNFKEDASRIGTPSTNASDPRTPESASGSQVEDMNQWVKKPTGLGVLGQLILQDAQAADPEAIYQKCGSREKGVLADFVNLWARSVAELLDKLKDTAPAGSMLSEVHYWRDMARVLEAANGELKQAFVETVIQVLACDPAAQADIQKLTAQRGRVAKGFKEARWNYKYLKVLEKPVQAIEQTHELRTIQMNVAPLLKTCKHVYENSSFYKEARIVSFIDRLVACLVAKIKARVSMRGAIRAGSQADSDYKRSIESALSICIKFEDAFFIKDMMREPTVEERLGGGSSKAEAQKGPEEESKADPAMGQSFYRKEGLDFLSFQRPGTAYGQDAFMNMTMGTATRSGFFQDKQQKIVKPIESMSSKNKTLLHKLWFSRAQKIID